MYGLEPKKLALLRILQILQTESDPEHPLKQEDIAEHLRKDYGIEIERKAIGRNLALLREAGYEIESDRSGSYLQTREFTDSELQILIDSVLSGKYISEKYSRDLIDKLCALSSRYFRSHIQYIHTVGEWGKTDNKALFYHIELVEEAIQNGKMVEYNYNKYGADKKLHKSSFQRISPYQLLLHNQRYYLMGYSNYWGEMVYHRMDRITDMHISDRLAIPIREVEGYSEGIPYGDFSTAMPYLFSDRPQIVEFIAEDHITDQIVDWFGKEIRIQPAGEGKIKVTLRVSPKAMEFWAMQYAKYVTVTAPQTLADQIRNNLLEAAGRYKKEN